MPSKFAIFFSLLILCPIISGSEIYGKGTASGKFTYKGDQCKWQEKRETRSMRSLNIQCGGKSPFSTAYEGDPHKCNWYQKGNQLKYYECLVAALMKANFCQNSPSQIACDKKGCGDVIFKKNGNGLLHRVISQALMFKETITEEEEPIDMY